MSGLTAAEGIEAEKLYDGLFRLIPDFMWPDAFEPLVVELRVIEAAAVRRALSVDRVAAALNVLPYTDKATVAFHASWDDAQAFAAWLSAALTEGDQG